MELRLLDVSKFYQTGNKSVKGVENINLTFSSDSSFVVITGESGSGKTTLIKLLTGIENFDDGEIYFDETPISTLAQVKKQDIYSQNVSFVFQDYNLIEGFTAKENIVLALIKKGISVEEAKAKALDALKAVGIDHLQNKRASKLSGGEKQRVAIARALSMESKVIIFDEPTGNLDKDTSENLIKVIQEVSKDRLVIFVTHEYSLVKDIATRHIVMQDGHIIEDKNLKKDKNDGDRFKDEKIKFPFKSLLYLASLFSFKRVGRLIFSFLVLFVVSLASFGISFLMSSLFTEPVPFQTNSYMQGNVINVYDRNNASVDEISENAFYDVASLIYDNNFNVYSAEDADKAKNLDNSSNSNSESGIVSSVVNRFALQVNTTLQKNVKLIAGEKSNENNVFYFVLNKSNTTGLFNKKYFNKYEKIVGKDAVIVPNKNIAYYLIDRSDGDIKLQSKGITNEIVDGREYSDVDTSYSNKIINGLKNLKRYKCAGIYVYNDDSSNYISEYIYFPSLEPINEIASFIRKDFEVSTFSYQEKKYIEQYYSQVYNYSISHDNYELVSGFSDTEKRFDNMSLKDIQKYSITEFNTVYLSDYWKDVDLNITINNIKLKKSQVSNIRYINDYLVENRYKYIIVGNPFTTMLLENKSNGKLYYSSETQAKESESKLKSKANIVKYDEAQTITFRAVDLKNVAVSTAIYQAVLLLFAIGVLFGMLVLYRLIFNKLYFRKAADQFVLNYIGYSRKDLFKSNLIQFEFLAILSSIIVYSLFLSLVSITRIIFVAVPYFFVFTLLIYLLFVVYLAIPFRYIGGGRKND